jgi:hypothetical protein
MMKSKQKIKAIFQPEFFALTLKHRDSKLEKLPFTVWLLAMQVPTQNRH